jgi:SulP family sulfate permease
MRALLKIDLSNLRGDFFGGLTAGIVALPLALAFGEQTELGAIAGLYGAIAIGVLAAFFGGTPTQISGPTAPMTVVATLIIMDAIDYAGSLAAALPMIVATFLLAGFMEMMLGVLKVGKYIKFIPYPVVSGFMSGIGIIIIFSQVFPFFGASSPNGGAIGVLKNLGTIPALINWYSVGVATLTIAIIYGFPKITKVVPSTLVALIGVSLAAFLFLSTGQLSIINDNAGGGVPTGLPTLQLDFVTAFASAGYIATIIKFAATLAALGAIDSLLTSVVADNITKTKHDSDQELIGQGIGNMASALLGGLPGAGSTTVTVINANSGGKTRLSGMIAGGLLFVILIGLGPLVGLVPNAVLAGILITVGFGIIDYKGFKYLRSIPRTDAVVMATVMLMTVFVGLLEAVATGVVMSALLFMKKISEVVENKTDTAPLRKFAREIPWHDEGDIIDRIGDQVYIKHLNGPLFFGFAARFHDMIKALPDIKVVIIRMDRVPYIDQSGLHAMEEAIMELDSKGIAVVFTGLTGQPEDMLRRINLVPGLVSDTYIFEDFEVCTGWLYEYLQQDINLDFLYAFQHSGKSLATPFEDLQVVK